MSNLLAPTEAFSALASLDPYLFDLWHQADTHNRKYGPRYWDSVYYGFGRFPFGFKEAITNRVGFCAPKDADPALKTCSAYDTVVNEIVKVLQRSKRATVGTTSPFVLTVEAR
jgi:hypothetical protein